MYIRSALVAALAALSLVACSAVEDEVVSHLKNVKVRDLDREQGDTRFRNFGTTTLKLVCRRTAETSGVCHTVPITGQFQNCMSYQVSQKTSIGFATLLMGEISDVTSTGFVPRDQCPRGGLL